MPKLEPQSRLEVIDEHFDNFHKNGRGWVASCPAHDDHKGSLSLNEGREGCVLVKCQAGCDTATVLDKAGLTWADLGSANGQAQNGQRTIVAVYDYRDERGELLYQSVRYEPKDFRQRKPDGNGGWSWSAKDVRRLPYNLPALLAVGPGAIVFVVEGEKDANNLVALGLVATTNVGGAGKWRDEYSEHLRGRTVVILPDNDEPGRKHGEDVAAKLYGIAASVKVLALPRLPEHGDVTDWIGTAITGSTVARKLKGQELIAMAADAPEWQPGGSAAITVSGELVTRRLSDVPAEPVCWLWRNRFASGKLNVVHGDPGVGKTWLVLYILAGVTRGRPFCDGAPCKRGEVLFVTAEDGIADTIRPRLDLLKADCSRAHCLDLVHIDGRDVSLDLEQHLEVLERWLIAHPGVTVVAMDPLAAFLGKIDSHRNNEVRAVLGRLAALAEKRQVTVLGIDHLAKAAGPAVHRGIGSIAFTAAPRAVWQVVLDQEDPGRRLFLPVKMNLARVAGLAYRLSDVGIVWEEGPVTISADEAAADSGETPRAEAKAWLKDMLRDGPCPASTVEQQAKKDGICMRTLKYAKKELGVESTRCAGEWSWSYPKTAAGQGGKACNTNPVTPLPSYPLRKAKKVTG
jgi:hypothetical protein